MASNRSGAENGNVANLYPNLYPTGSNGNHRVLPTNGIHIPKAVPQSTPYNNDMEGGSQHELIPGARPKRSWKHYSHLEKSLWIALGFVSTLCVLLIIGIALLGRELAKDDEVPLPTKATVSTEIPPWLTIGTPNTTTTRRPIPTTLPPGYYSCVTPECTTAAYDILQAIDMNVDPCQDFYQFACGGWMKKNPIPKINPKWHQTDLMQQRLMDQIKSILKMKEGSQEFPEPLLMAQSFYETCVKQDNQNNYDNLKAFVDAFLNEGDEVSGAGKIRRALGGNYLWTLYVDLDEYETQNNTIYVDQPEFGIARAYLVDAEENKYVTAYQTLIEEIWQAVYGSADDAKAVAESIVAFESRLANISTRPEDRRDKEQLYNPMSIEDLSAFLGNESTIVWPNYFEEVFDGVAEDVIWNERTVIVRDLPFFTELASVLNEATAEDAEIIQKYLKWRIFFTLANDVSEDFRKLVFKFTQVTQGLKARRPIDEACVTQTNSIFGMAISYGYIQEYFQVGNDKANEMVDAIRSAFTETLYSPELGWLSAETRKAAEEKAQKMSAKVGYPEWLFNDANATKNIFNYYEDLELPVPDSSESHALHLLNVQAALEWKSVRQLQQINETKDSNRWNTDPTVLNAFYSSVYNSITLPAGILQQPFYGAPLEYLNYGAIGSIVGHELTHGFDDRGRQNDADGNLADWWDEETLGNYTEAAECFVDQYSNYIVPELGIPLNGRNTLGENIADNSGVNVAFRAYQNFVLNNGEEKYLPGFTQYTPNQMFFLAYAQVWCGAYTKESLETQVKGGVHSPPSFRVKGVMQNSADFQLHWNCPAGAETCRIW